MAGTAGQRGFLPPFVSLEEAPLDLPHLTFPKLVGVCQTQDTSRFQQVHRAVMPSGGPAQCERVLERVS